MSDTPKIHPIDVYRKKKEKKEEEEIRTRIRQREIEEGFSRLIVEPLEKDWNEFLAGPGVPIVDKIKRLPNFIVDSRLLSFKKGKSYPLENEGLIQDIAFNLYTLEEMVRSTELPSYYYLQKELKYFHALYDKIVIILEKKGVKTQKGDMKIRNIIDSWEKQYTDLGLKERHNSKVHSMLLKELLGDSFLPNVPEANNSDIARHILNIMKTLTEIPSRHLPKYNSLRQLIKEYREYHDDKEREKNRDILDKLDAEERLLIEELKRVRKQIRKQRRQLGYVEDESEDEIMVWVWIKKI